MNFSEDISLASREVTNTSNSLRTGSTEDGVVMNTIQNDAVVEGHCNTVCSGKELNSVPETDEALKNSGLKLRSEDSVQNFSLESFLGESLPILEPRLLDILESNDHVGDCCEESALLGMDTAEQFIDSMLEPLETGCSIDSTSELFMADGSVKSTTGQSKDNNELAKCNTLITNSSESLVGTSVSQNTTMPSTGWIKDSEPNNISSFQLKRFASTKQSAATVMPSDVTLPSIYSCSHCNFKTKTRNHFESHRQNHWISGTYKCELCTFSSDFRTSCTRHKRCHHLEETITKVTCRPTDDNDRLKRGQFSCTECLYKTYNRAFFVRHRRFHLIPSEFKCDHCSFSVSIKSVLASHIKKYHNNGSVNLDGKALKATKKSKPHAKPPVKLKAQVDNLSDEHDFVQSSQASYSQVTKDIVVTKVLNSHGVLVSRFHCPLCDYSCTKCVLCRKHVEKHTAKTTQAATRMGKNRILTVMSAAGNKVYEREYICPKCPYTSTKKSSCQKHIRRAHTINSGSDEPSVFRCRICPLALFSNKFNLQRHMVSKHLNHKQGHLKSVRRIRMTPIKKSTAKEVLYHRVTKKQSRGKSVTLFMCDMCGLSFRTKAKIDSHMHFHKEGKLTWKCAFCKAMFTTDAGKRTHTTRMHADEIQAHDSEHKVKSQDQTNNCSSMTTQAMRTCSVVLSRYQRRQTARKKAAGHRQKSAVSAPSHFHDLLPPVDSCTDRVASWLSSCAMTRNGDSDTHNPSMVTDLVVSSPYSISMSTFTSCGPTQPEELPKADGKEHSVGRVTEHGFIAETEATSNTVREFKKSVGHVVGHGECSRQPVEVERTKFICDQCPQLFATMELLTEHQLSHGHGHCDLMTCAYCSFSNDNADVLQQHIESHFKVHLYYNATGLCVAYRRQHYFDELPQEHKSSDSTYSKKFKNRSIYRQESKPDGYICKFCDLQVASLPDLICHENRHLVGSDHLFF